MGEPPAQIESRIDGNYRLRRMYFKEKMPDRHRDIRIGQAVAASSCVPGLFAPLELRDLYNNITVRLVDGGVHDNQGVFGLLDQNCTVFIVSDASGQMSTVDNPKDGLLSILMRSNSISMARVRAAEYCELLSRKESGRLKGLLFLHLKKELGVLDRDWVHCDNPKELPAEALKDHMQKLTGYNIPKSIQEKIANIRTDLDSFNETEALALMTSGCNMVRTEFSKEIEGFQSDSRQHDWAFLDIEPALRTPETKTLSRVSTLLKVASNTAFKIWRLSPLLKCVAVTLGLALFGILSWFAWCWRGETISSWRGVGATVCVTLLSILACSLGLKFLVWAVRYRKTAHQILIGIGLCLFGVIAAWIHLYFFDSAFLRKGRIPRNRARED